MKWIMEGVVKEPSTLTRTSIHSPPPGSQSTMQTSSHMFVLLSAMALAVFIFFSCRTTKGKKKRDT
ncbi:hypothetical protein ANO14919_099770 [Xylariales sp. No.14919]|nr:hypothetical protein ANO14919_099770 [Xylariales sp. No.14919]